MIEHLPELLTLARDHWAVLTVAAYHTIGWALAVRDLPGAWESTRHHWNTRNGPAWDQARRQADIRADVRIHFLTFATLWPLFAAAWILCRLIDHLAWAWDHVITTLDRAISRRDPQAAQDRAAATKRAIVDLEHQLGMNPDPAPHDDLTPDDEACLRMLARAHVNPGTTLTLPSGREITGVEFNRLIKRQP